MAESDEDIIREAQERFDRAHDYQAFAHENFRRDMKFANGDDVNRYQWDEEIVGSRVGRPCLTINKCRIHNLQVINDARQNQAQIRINPVADEATYESAQIFEGVVRHIEYVSNAAAAYTTATYNQVMGGIGYWRVMTDYIDEETLDQDIFIRRVPNPLDVFLDPDIQQYDGSDARFGFVFYEMERKDFERRYPRADEPDRVVGSGPLGNRGHFQSDDKHVRLVEYYRRGERRDRLLELTDGTVLHAADLAPEVLRQVKARDLIRRERTVSYPEVEWFLIADNDRILDRKPWPGRYIPIVRLPCEEIITDKRLDWVSHTRHLRDAQRLYNWYSSSAAEFVALQSKAPFIGTAEAIGPFQEKWERANIENPSVLLYQGLDETGQPQPPPQRAQPPAMAQAYMEGLQIAQNEMMLASGQYQAVMGAPSNETSGKAINARQRQGDNATYHVIDHLAGAIRFTGRLLVDLVPKVYNARRVLLIVNEAGEESQVHVDPEAPQAHQVVPDPTAQPQPVSPQGQADPDQAKEDAVITIWNPNVGRFAVVADVGPSYMTRRQEAFNAFSQLMASNGAAFQVLGDFWAKNADFPGADELAERLKQGLPAQYKGQDPQVMQLQQALQQTQAHAQQVLGQADAEVAALKAQVAALQEDLKDKTYDSETKRLDTVGKIDPDSLKLIVRELVSQMIGMPALPVMGAHAAAEAAMTPPGPAPDSQGGGQVNGQGGGQALQ